MKLGIVALALCVAATGAKAQSVFSNDYEAVFDQNSEKIARKVAEDGGTIEEIELPGPVMVQRRLNEDGPVYQSQDFSGLGAVGCMMGLLLQFQKTANACPAEVAPEQKARLSSALIRVGLFYAENRVPKVSEIEMIEAIAESGKEGGSCQQMENAGFRDLFDNILSEGLTEALDGMLSEPRLPVVNPCL